MDPVACALTAPASSDGPPASKTAGAMPVVYHAALEETMADPSACSDEPYVVITADTHAGAHLATYRDPAIGASR